MAAPSALGALASAIHDRLLAGDPAALPGLGQLGRVHVPARVHTRPDGSKLLLPPSETVGLTREAGDASPLAALLLRHLGTPQADPARTLRDTVDQLEAHLAATGEVRLPGVGVFQRTSSGIRFGAAPDLLSAVNRAYDGLQPVGRGDADAPVHETPPPASAERPASQTPAWAPLLADPPREAPPAPATDAPEPEPQAPDPPPVDAPNAAAARPDASGTSPPAPPVDPGEAVDAPPLSEQDAWLDAMTAPPAQDETPPPSPDAEPAAAVPSDAHDVGDDLERLAPTGLLGLDDMDTLPEPTDVAAAEPEAQRSEAATPFATEPVASDLDARHFPWDDADALPPVPADEPVPTDGPEPLDAPAPPVAAPTPSAGLLDDMDTWASDIWTSDGAIPPPGALGAPAPIEDADFSLIEPDRPVPDQQESVPDDAPPSWVTQALGDVRADAPPLPRPDPAAADLGSSAPRHAQAARPGPVIDRIPPSPTDLDAIAAEASMRAGRRWTGGLWGLAVLALIVTAVLFLLPKRAASPERDDTILQRPAGERPATGGAPLIVPVDSLGPAPVDNDPAPSFDGEAGETTGTPDASASGGGSSRSAAPSAPTRPDADRRALGRAPAPGQAILPPRMAGLSADDADALSGRTPVVHGAGGYTWVVLSSTSRAEAAALEDRYREAGYRAGLIVTTSGGRTTYRVVVGQFGDRAHALRLRDRLPPQAPPDTWPLDLR